MVTAERRRKLELGLRKARGDRMRPGWLTALKGACGVDVAPDDFLPLAETEALKEAFYKKSSTIASVHRYWPKHAFAEVALLLRDRALTVGPMPVVLFSSADQYIGAVHVPADRILTHAEEVWRLVEEDLGITTGDLQQGLRLELNYYAEEGEYIKDGVYELTAWGAFAP